MSMGPNDMVLVGPSVWHIPLLDRLEPAARAGFTVVSVTPGDIWALEAQGMKAGEIARRIADAGLEISDMECIGCWLPSQRAAASAPDAAMNLLNLEPEPVLDTAARIGAKTVAVVDMIAGANPRDAVVEAFANICDLAAAMVRQQQVFASAFGTFNHYPTRSHLESTSRFYLRLSTEERPGILAVITRILGEHSISISAIIQKEASEDAPIPIVILTRSATEKNLRAATAEIEKLPFVHGTPVVLHVEDIAL